MIRVLFSVLTIISTLWQLGCSGNVEAPSQPTQQAPGSASTLPGAETGIPAWVGDRPDEPFDVKAFLESREPPVDDTAAQYFAGLAELCNEMDFVYPLAEREAHLKKVRVVSERIFNLSDREKLLAGTVSLAELEEVLAITRPALQKLDHAQANGPCIFVTGMRPESLLPHAQAARLIGQLAQLEIFHASATNDFEMAEKAVERTLRLARDLRPRGPGISQLVSVSIAGVTLTAVNDFMLAIPSLDPNHCDRLLAILKEHEDTSIAAFEEGVRMQYIIERNIIDDFHQGRRTHLNPFNMENELNALNEIYSQLLDAAPRPYHEVLPKIGSLGTQLEQIKSQGVYIVPLILTDFDGLRAAEARDATRLRACESLIIVSRYMCLHGQPPADLETAFREVAQAAVPIDPYSGQPLRYTILKGRPTVYSVGADQKDDGASIDWKLGKLSGDFIFTIGPLTQTEISHDRDGSK